MEDKVMIAIMFLLLIAFCVLKVDNTSKEMEINRLQNKIEQQIELIDSLQQ